MIQNAAHRKNKQQFSGLKPKLKGTKQYKPSINGINGPSIRASHNDAINFADYNSL